MLWRTYIDDTTPEGLETIAGIDTRGNDYGIEISPDIECRNFRATGIATATIGVTTIGFATVGVLTSSSLYQTSTGKISIPGNQLNTWTNFNINLDLSQSMVAIGTIGREPIWNFTNVSVESSRMATVTVVATSSSTTQVSMGRTYTINGGSNRQITWATTSVPNFDITNWNILTFRILNDSVGITSVFAVKE